MKTSYFARYKENNGVAISTIIPSWYIGKEYRKLSPKHWISIQYIQGIIDEREYTELYYEHVLSKLDARVVYQELIDLVGSEDIVLLCYEKSDKFCHRHIVSEWLSRELGINISELI